ncbi:MAG: GTP-binding protein [Candidatus Pacebacteria bacterium]|nr:GTP-binding protein [Candidatus Paceibacterota bacterium]
MFSKMLSTHPGKLREVNLTVLGDSFVGKTSILNRFKVDNVSRQVYSPTCGLDIVRRDIRIDKRELVAVKVWDSAGQDRFYGVIPPLFKHYCDGLMMVFDVCERRSFLDALRVLHQIGDSILPHVVISLVGNKIDKEEERQVSAEEAEEVAEERGMLYSETSAKANMNVFTTIESLVREIWLPASFCSEETISVLSVEDPQDDARGEPMGEFRSSCLC